MAAREFIVMSRKNLAAPTFGHEWAFSRSDLSRFMPVSVEISKAELTEKEVSKLRRDPMVDAVAPVMPVRLIAPTESALLSEAEVARLSSPTWGVRAVRAAESSCDGSGVTVAVLDTGIDPDHPAFAGVELLRRNITISQQKGTMTRKGTARIAPEPSSVKMSTGCALASPGK